MEHCACLFQLRSGEVDLNEFMNFLYSNPGTRASMSKACQIREAMVSFVHKSLVFIFSKVLMCRWVKSKSIRLGMELTRDSLRKRTTYQRHIWVGDGLPFGHAPSCAGLSQGLPTKAFYSTDPLLHSHAED